MNRGVAVAALSVVIVSTAAGQRLPRLRAYYLNVALGADSSALAPRGAFDFQRLRLMASPSIGDLTLDLAYEQTLTWSSAAGAGGPAVGLGQTRVGTDWLPLQGTLASSTRFAWADRLDRLSLRYSTDAFEITAGRQPISWATTLLFTPADPFAPFNPSDPFREYRAGVDALRVRAFPGPLSEIEAVVRPAAVAGAHPLTALGRGQLTIGSWELSAWGGAVYGDPAFAAGATVTVAGAALRAEGVVRRTGGRSVLRAAVGADRRVTALGRDLMLAVEYQRDGFGAASAAALPSVLISQPAARGELQVFGRDELALHPTWQVHPLVALDVVALWNLDDGSVLLAPSLAWSAAGSVTVRAGAFAGAGAGALRSEYGEVPASAYASASLFF